MRYLFCIAFVVLGFPAAVKADSWGLPQPTKYCSANKKHCLKVDPKNLESQLSYFKDKVEDQENSGADKKVKENFCKGTFTLNGKKAWSVRLDNEVAPVNVLISDTGDYVITFDNWGGVGYGNNVVAIYEGASGRLVKKLGLTDFLTESDVYSLPTSTSSIWWRGTHQIDYEKKQLVLKVVKSESEKTFFDVHIALKDGEVLDEIVDRLPSLRLLLSTKVEQEVTVAFPVREEQKPCESKEAATQISTDELHKRILSNEFPEYPPAARAIRATGESVFEVVISEEGDVECINPISGHPLLRAAIVNSVKTWKFEKSSTKYKGNIIIEGKFALVLNGKEVSK